VYGRSTELIGIKRRRHRADGDAMLMTDDVSLAVSAAAAESYQP